MKSLSNWFGFELKEICREARIGLTISLVLNENDEMNKTALNDNSSVMPTKKRVTLFLFDLIMQFIKPQIFLLFKHLENRIIYLYKGIGHC